MSNPLRIIKTLDQHLSLPGELTLFGRSALALGFSNAPDHFHNTQDVDGILPLAWLQPPDEHQDFWQAVQRTNIELEPDGLYLTHLFREVDVILQPDWLSRRLQLNVGLRKLAVFRPATIDLILTKMHRGFLLGSLAGFLIFPAFMASYIGSCLNNLARFAKVEARRARIKFGRIANTETADKIRLPCGARKKHVIHLFVVES
jgi:hypothetical protein